MGCKPGLFALPRLKYFKGILRCGSQKAGLSPHPASIPAYKIKELWRADWIVIFT